MAEDIRSMRIEVSMRDLGVERTVGQIKQSFKTLKSEALNSTRMFNRSEKSASGYYYQLKNLKVAQANLKNELKAATREEAKMVEQHGENSTQALRASETVSKLKEEINYMGHQITQTTNEMKLFKKNQAIDSSSWTKAGNTFSSMGDSIKSVSTKMGDMGRSFSNKITKPALVAGAAVGGITAKLGFDRLVGLDTAKAKLEGLGYSTKEVGSITDQVTNAIKGGMTTMAEGTDVAAGALAAGVKEGKDLEKYIKLVGDAAVGANRPVADMAMIFNRVQGQGKLMTQELNMVEEGMPGFSNAMAEHLGVSYDAFREMVTNGEVTSNDFLTVMDDFAGGMAKAYSKSWQGMVQNTKAYIGQIGEGLLSGTFEQAKGSLHEFEKLLSSDAAQKWAQETGVKLANAFTTIANGIKGVLDWWNGLGGTTQKVLGGIVKWSALTLVAVGPMLTIFSKLGLAISGMFGPMTTLMLNMGKISGAMKTGSTFASAFASVFPKLSMVLGALTGPIGLTVLAITGLVTAFVIAYKKSETFRNIVNGAIHGVVEGFKLLWSGIMTVLTPIGQAISKFGQQIAKTFGQFWAENGPQFMQALNNIKTGFVVMWTFIQPVLSQIGSLFKTVFGGILSFIQFIMPAIQAIFRVGWSLIKYIFVSTWQAIKGVVMGGLNIIMGLIKVFSGLFTGDFSKMWEGVKQIFFGAFKFIWNLVQLWFVGKIFGVFKLGLNLIKSIVKGSLGSVRGTFSGILSSIWGIVKKIFTSIWNFIKSIFTNIANFTRNIWNLIKLLVTNPVKGIKTIVSANFQLLSKIVRSIFSALSKVIGTIWRGIKNTVVGIAKALYNTIRNRFQLLKDIVSKITKSLGNALKATWNWIKNTIVGLAKSLYNTAKSVFTTMSKVLRSITSTLSKVVKSIWSGLRNAVVKTIRALFSTAKSIFNSIRKTLTNITQGLKNAVTGKWKALKKSITDLATGAKNGVVNGFKAMYNKGVEWMNKLKGFITDAKDGFKKVATDLGKGVANGAISGLNAMIDGINWLSDKIMKKKLIKNKVKTLSTGTGANPNVSTDSQGRLTRPTKAIVNDKGLGNANGPRGHKEIIHRKSGKIEKPVGNNKRVNLRRGDAVYSGMQSKSIMPHLSTGTGADLLKRAKKHKHGDEVHGDMYVPTNSGHGGGGGWDWVVKNTGKAYNSTKEGLKAAKDKIGKAIGDVMDYASNPGKLVDKVLKQFGVDFSSVKGAMGDTMSFGYSGLKKLVKDKITGWFDEMEGGDGDGGYIDLSRGINFGFARTAAEAAANGYPFPRAHHGLDINYPYGTNVYSTVSGKATAKSGWNGGFGNSMWIKSGIMDVIYGHLSKLQFSGTKSVKPGTLLGKSGGDPARQGAGAGSSTGPHLHYEMRKNGVPFDPTNWLKKNNGGGKAGGKYASTIKKALGMAGLPQTAKYIKAWQSQAKTESTFNPKAKNPSGASGLVQVKPATFNQYKLPGHGNIWNPLDNLIAGMRYAKARYGPKKMLNQIGHGLPYKTGGVINQAGTYHLAEDGHSEVVVPLDPSRASDAMKLITYAQSKIKDKKNKKPNQMPNNYGNDKGYDNNTLLQMLAQQVQKQDKQIELLTKLVTSTQNIEQQPKGYDTDDVSHGLGKKARSKQFNFGMS
jgi:tape measure domain-containing protein